MAKIVQPLTRPSKQYEQKNADALIRDLDSLIQKLNSIIKYPYIVQQTCNYGSKLHYLF